MLQKINKKHDNQRQTRPVQRDSINSKTNSLSTQQTEAEDEKDRQLLEEKQTQTGIYAASINLSTFATAISLSLHQTLFP